LLTPWFILINLRNIPPCATWGNHKAILHLLQVVDYAYTALYTHNCMAFQGITRKIGLSYSRGNYACNTLAIKSARKLCVPQHATYIISFESYGVNTGDLRKDAKAGGSRKARAV